MKSFSALAVLALVATGACGKKTEPAVPQPQPQPTTSAPTTSAPPTTEPTRNPEPARSGLTSAEILTLQNTIAEPVYFEYDSERIGTVGTASLERKHIVLAANMTVRIRIEGNADDRGSDEYNLALGQRRAEAAKKWLVNRGIDGARITTVSYGEERPAERGTAEGSYAKNRRDNFTVTAGTFTVGQDH